MVGERELCCSAQVPDFPNTQNLESRQHPSEAAWALYFRGSWTPFTAGSSLQCELDFCLESRLQPSGEWWAQLTGSATPRGSSSAGSEEEWLSHVLGNSMCKSVNNMCKSVISVCKSASNICKLVSCPPPGTQAELQCCTGRAPLLTGPGYSDLCQNAAPHAWPGLDFTVRWKWLDYHLV